MMTMLIEVTWQHVVVTATIGMYAAYTLVDSYHTLEERDQYLKTYEETTNQLMEECRAVRREVARLREEKRELLNLLAAEQAKGHGQGHGQGKNNNKNGSSSSYWNSPHSPGKRRQQQRQRASASASASAPASSALASASSSASPSASASPWSDLPPMNHPRSGFASVVVGKRLFVFGGQRQRQRKGQSTDDQGNGKGKGNGDHMPLSSVEMYDPKLRRWSIMGPMLYRRYRFAAAPIGDTNTILICGGIGCAVTDKNGNERDSGDIQREDLCVLSHVELYDMDSGSSKPLPPMNYPRYGCTAVPLNKKVFVFGGIIRQERNQNGQGYHHRLRIVGEVFSSHFQLWVRLPVLNTIATGWTGVADRTGWTAGWGGRSPTMPLLLDPPPLPPQLAAAAVGEKIIVLGECYAGYYDTMSGRWHAFPANARVATNEHGAVALGDRIFILENAPEPPTTTATTTTERPDDANAKDDGNDKDKKRTSSPSKNKIKNAAGGAADGDGRSGRTRTRRTKRRKENGAGSPSPDPGPGAAVTRNMTYVFDTTNKSLTPFEMIGVRRGDSASMVAMGGKLLAVGGFDDGRESAGAGQNNGHGHGRHEEGEEGCCLSSAEEIAIPVDYLNVNDTTTGAPSSSSSESLGLDLDEIDDDDDDESDSTDDELYFRPCIHCNRPNASSYCKLCGADSIYYYCNHECQSADWHIHKRVCRKKKTKTKNKKKAVSKKNKHE